MLNYRRSGQTCYGWYSFYVTVIHCTYLFNFCPHILQSTLEQARAIKQQGNELYKQQKFEEAIKCYKEAIQVCPADKKEDLAIFHQNLAAVYDMLVRCLTLCQ